MWTIFTQVDDSIKCEGRINIYGSIKCKLSLRKLMIV